MPKIRALKPDFWTDDAIVELSPLARLLFMGLWTHACDNGHVEDKPRQIKMRVLPADDCSLGELLDELTSSGRIRRENGWVVIINFAKHQKIDKRFFTTCQRRGCAKPGEKPPTSQRESRGEHDEHTTSTRRGHDETTTTPTERPHGGGDGDSDGDVDSDGDTSRELTLHEAPRADVDRICDHLADRVEANGAKRPTITAKWRTAARLMLDNDGRPEQHIHAAIDWCQSDEFWRANVLSLPKLREKYDQLLLQAQRGPRTGNRNQEQRNLLERAMERAQERERNGA